MISYLLTTKTHQNGNCHVLSYRITYIGDIGGGKPPGCGLALPC
jgi:hypothetical protein